MTRIGKKAKRKAISHRKCKAPSVKTGPKQDKLPDGGYKKHENALEGDLAGKAFIAKIQ